MAGAASSASRLLARAKKDEKFRLALQANPKQVLERELGRELSKEELEAAIAELKKHGVKFDSASS